MDFGFCLPSHYRIETPDAAHAQDERVAIRDDGMSIQVERSVGTEFK